MTNEMTDAEIAANVAKPQACEAVAAEHRANANADGLPSCYSYIEDAVCLDCENAQQLADLRADYKRMGGR